MQHVHGSYFHETEGFFLAWEPSGALGVEAFDFGKAFVPGAWRCPVLSVGKALETRKQKENEGPVLRCLAFSKMQSWGKLAEGPNTSPLKIFGGCLTIRPVHRVHKSALLPPEETCHGKIRLPKVSRKQQGTEMSLRFSCVLSTFAGSIEDSA